MYDKFDKISVNIWILQRNTTDPNDNDDDDNNNDDDDDNNNNNNNLQCVYNCEQQECQPNEFTGTNIWECSRMQRTEPPQCGLV